jgi:4-diphosphocytidyl-2-C-methyl-D-erythritol kinase
MAACSAMTSALLHWPRQQLLQLALTLGADVPFFVNGRPAFVEGIGEQLTPMPLRPQWFAVVKPPTPIATAAIFSNPMLRRDTEAAIVIDFLADTQLQQRLSGEVPQNAVGFGRNDLQAPAENHCPEVAQAARWLEARYGNSRMSGSGSAVFARAGTGIQPVATWGADDLPPRWVGRLCRSLDHHPLVGWAD